MGESVLRRIPVVGGLGYVERVRGVPPAFTAVLAPEPENRYFPRALAVLVNGEKVGYVAPEIGGAYFDGLVARGDEPVTCPGRRGELTDHETSGVELLLDFSDLLTSHMSHPILL